MVDVMVEEEAQNEAVYTDVLEIPVDPEPLGLRLALFGILLIGVILGYAVITTVFSVGTCNLLGVFGGLGLGALLMQIAERILKPSWKSNRFVRLTPTSFEVKSGNRTQEEIDPAQDIEVHFWRFEVKRRTRVPKGWYVVGLAFEQEADFLSVFTLVSPETFSDMDYADAFAELIGHKEREKRDIRLSGQQRRLMRAENARNLHGHEMQPEDFETCIGWLDVHFPEWMPTRRA